MNKYMTLLKTRKGELKDLCFELYHMLKHETQTDAIKYFQLICENINNITSNESKELKEYITSEEISVLENIYGEYINEAVVSVRKKTTYQKLGVKDFYQLLWSTVFNNSIFVSDKESAFALLLILVNDSIPYYEIGTPLSMDDEEYKDIIQSHEELINRIEYILSIPFKQRTELASLFLNELEGIEYKTQVVLLSQMLARYSHKRLED